MNEPFNIPDLEIDLDASFASQLVGRGAKAKPLSARVVRELTIEDFLKANDLNGQSTPVIKDLRTSHHQLAQLLAQGIAEQEASIITGYSLSRIAILKNDPSFSELFAYYADMEKEQYKTARADFAKRLATFGFNTIEELQSRLEEAPETFSTNDLLKALELTSDRTGHGKTSTINANVSHSLSPETLERIRSAANETESVSISQADRQALLGAVIVEAEFYSENSAQEGNSA